MKRLRLVVFDVDGTLIRINSSWRFLHQKLGTWERGSKYADQFFRGQISYEDWAKLDASLWKHTPLERVQKIMDNIPYTDSTCEVATLLKNEGLKVVLLSAGLSVVTDKVSREIGARAGLSLYWCKVVIILIFGFGGRFETNSPSLFLCSNHPSQTCKHASSD